MFVVTRLNFSEVERDICGPDVILVTPTSTIYFIIKVLLVLDSGKKVSKCNVEQKNHTLNYFTSV